MDRPPSDDAEIAYPFSFVLSIDAADTPEEERMRTLGIGIIGLHHLHPMDYLTHFAALPSTRVCALSEADAVLRQKAAAATGLPVYAEYGEVLARDDVDAVFIFLPHADCPAAAAAAAEAGKHVVVEKPMAATSDGIRRMVAAAQAAGVSLSAPFCWRYHPAARHIKEVVEGGKLGRVLALEGRCAAGSPLRYRRDGISPWILAKASAGGGPLHNLGVHWIDLFRWLLEDEVDTVTGMVSHEQHGLEVEDAGFALLRFAGGATASLDISYSVPDAYPAGRDLYIGLRGTEGALSWSPAWGGTADEVFLCSSRPEMADGPVRRVQIASRSVGGYGGICGLAYLRRLTDDLLAGRPPQVTGSDGLRALEVVEAVYTAAETGRTVRVERR
ncbi:MAG: Gfo/Idh/MocA family oxidoreductase [Candidatus Latescibacterota bacterium]